MLCVTGWFLAEMETEAPIWAIIWKYRHGRPVVREPESWLPGVLVRVGEGSR